MKKSVLSGIVILVFMAAAALSCPSNDYYYNDYLGNFDLAEFDSKMAAWKSLGIHAYQFEGYTVPPSPPEMPVTVTVLPGVEPKFTYDLEKINIEQEKKISQGEPFFPLSGSTIDDLFDSIRNSALMWRTV
jgi:hypothetical protein